MNKKITCETCVWFGQCISQEDGCICEDYYCESYQDYVDIESGRKSFRQQWDTYVKDYDNE